MSVRKTVDIEVTLENGDKVIRQFEDLGNGVLKLADSSDKLEASFEEVYNGMQPLTTRMGEAEDRLYELALAGDTTSKEYQELLTKVGEYRKVQIQTDLAVDQAAQTFSQKLGTALGGATSGFAVVQGTMALVGSESEALEKTLLKVQAALAIQQGVQGVVDYSKSVGLATKATKLWNLALKANPIGLVITAVVGLIAAVGALSAAFNSSAKAREEEYQAQLKQIDATKQQITDRQNQLKLEDRYAENRIKELELDKDLAKSKEEIAAIDAKIAAERIAGFERERKAVRANQEKAIQDALAQEKRLQKQFEDERDKTFYRSQERVDQAQAIFIESQKITNKLRKQLEEDNFQSIVEINTREAQFEQEERNKSIEAEKEANQTKLDNYRDYLQSRLAAQRYIEDLQFAIMEEGVEKEVAISNAKFNRMIEDALKNEKFTEEEKAKIKDLLLVQQFEKEDALRQADRDKRIDETFGELERLDLVEGQKTDIVLKGVEARDSIYKQVADKQKARTDKEKADALALEQAKIQFANQSLSAIANLVNSFAGESEKAQKRAFNITKGINIAQAVINTAGAISAAINPAVGGLGIPAGLPGAVLAAATGAAQIATIAKTEFQGGGGADVQSPTDSVEAQAPSFNVVGDSGINQLASLKSEPVKAFVVSGEVTTSQALDRNRVENATL